MTEYKKGTFGYDAEFLKKYAEAVELINGDSRLMLSAKFQGRVMTSSAEGLKGKSYGWINHDFIKSGEVLKNFNPVGGEERFWIGPEGGQYSLFFKPNTPFNFENWNAPACIDREPFKVIHQTDSFVDFGRAITVKNYQGFVFNFNVKRRVELLCNENIEQILDIVLSEHLKVVGYKTDNRIKNIGKDSWKKGNGLLSIWLLGMYNPSPTVTIFIPYMTGVESEYIVKDDYFGKIPANRFVISDGMIYLKGDGKHRGKIGIPPQRALSVFGSYDSENHLLTIVKCNIPKGVEEYVNSAWEYQKNPFNGDIINAYNDGPLEDGGQLGPFYELESSSPALKLNPGQSYNHQQITFHFQGDDKYLDPICKQIFNVSLERIKSIFF